MNEKRKITPFLAQEMLFDFATGELDSERHAAVQAFVKDDRESQQLLEAIKRGIQYAESLKKIELTDDTYEDLDRAENFVSLSKRLARWSEWPDSLRWSIIALGVSICTAAVVVEIPWRTIPLFRTGPSFDSGSIEIARVESRKANGEEQNLAANVAEDTKEQESGPLEGSGDEEFAEESSGATASVASNPAPAAKIVVPPAAPVAIAPAPVVKTPVAKAPPVVTPPVTSAPTAVPTAAAGASSKASRSFVYRAFMTLDDLEDIAPKITQQIKELGAEKAGEVELGWQRGSGRYYHFTIPESNEQKLLESLRVYGPVRISKDPHPRVMPEGQVRFILWIESGT